MRGNVEFWMIGTASETNHLYRNHGGELPDRTVICTPDELP